MSKTLFILNDPPYGTERSFNGLRLAGPLPSDACSRQAPAQPYDNDIVVQLITEGGKVRMVVSVDRHRDDEWTERAVAGFESQLTKLPAALAATRAGRELAPPSRDHVP